METKPTVSVQQIAGLILMIRGQKVMLDTDLAKLYGVETGTLNRAVKRNIQRFPKDFMFRITREEMERLRCQTGISKRRRGGRRYLPYAFTEQGVAMLSSVLKSRRAIDVNIAIMRAFVKIREMLGAHRELAAKLKELESHIQNHDEQIQTIFEAIRQLMTPPEKPRKKIGFEVKEPKAKYGKKQ